MRDAAVLQRGFEELRGNIDEFIRGKSEVVRLALVCLLAEGHLLIEDVPGVAKTSLAKAIARSVAGASVRRIQFTPDLLPSDVTGVQVYDQGSGRFEFRQGPVFTNILLGDEINRASPKTQSALLEVMAEGQVTVDGHPVRVPSPFLCIATQNPVEHQGTYALPEAQLDRFMMRINVGYPDGLADEVSILADGIARRRPEQLTSVMELDDLRMMIRAVREQHVAGNLQEYIASVVRATRAHPEVTLGVSPRGGIALAAAAQAYSLCAGRAFVTADDVKAVAVPVLNHRLLLTPDARIEHRTPESIVRDILTTAPAPTGQGSR
ncbi:MoxR-like ATPase [Kibdelosporangium banguiense]|uniref:MoxR-like ATPase n=1 Tax=Kibdelosporangium banguiense TaxID=1365924 RepID=A0ABS4U0A3_9PSEU|nr:MoxR family ATPase [Kibdelosporangium banguiense]MBP2329591.1 MoxR-like ATPase [Kibdelosporangium banguiense]